MNKLSTLILKNLIIFVGSLLFILKTYGSLPFQCSLTLLLILSVTLLSYKNSQKLVYNKDGIKNGEYWRFLTCHTTHETLLHLAFNIGGLLLLWILYGNYLSNKQFLYLFIFVSIICSIGLFIINEPMDTSVSYTGMSGALMGILSYGAVKDIINKRLLGYLFLGLLIIKIYREQTKGSHMKDILEMEIEVDAHLYGAIGGLLYLFIRN